MFRFVVVAVVVTVVLAEENKKCRRLFHPTSIHCCKNDIGPPKMKIEDLRECFDMKHKTPSCDADICIGKKRGYASDDSTVDMDAFERIITEDLKNTPTLVEAIKENCIKGDLSKYGPPDACKLIQLRTCVHKTMVMECKEWDDDLVRKCAKMDD